jgi:hypothetical protein
VIRVQSRRVENLSDILGGRRWLSCAGLAGNPAKLILQAVKAVDGEAVAGGQRSQRLLMIGSENGYTKSKNANISPNQ